MKRTHVALAFALVSCATSLLFVNSNPSDGVVEAAPRLQAGAFRSRDDKSSAVGVSIAALRSRKALYGATADGDHNLFEGQAMVSPLPSVAPAQAEAPPLPPPGAPSVPFTYIGKKAADGVWEVYLGRGQETLIVREQTVIDSTYRVEAIHPPTLSLIYLPLKQVQTLDIGGAN